jgi:N-acetyl-anhydromuramyl-L-alanine amidase AmpD
MTQFRPTRIILHCSATKDGLVPDTQAIRRWHTGQIKTPDNPYAEFPMADIAYHFLIELVNTHYEIFVGRMLDRMGAHCGGENDDSIGICFVGNFDSEPPPLEQWQLGTQLVRSLCYIYCIGHDKVFGHREFTTRKTCPGLKFNLDEFRKQLHPY